MIRCPICRKDTEKAIVACMEFWGEEQYLDKAPYYTWKELILELERYVYARSELVYVDFKCGCDLKETTEAIMEIVEIIVEKRGYTTKMLEAMTEDEIARLIEEVMDEVRGKSVNQPLKQ